MKADIIIALLFSCCVCDGELIDSFGEITDFAKHMDMKNRLEALAEKMRVNQDIFLNANIENGIKRDYMNDRFAEFTDGLSIMIKVMESHISRIRFGNVFGVVLNDYACAHVSGSHMLLVFPPANETRKKTFNFEKHLPAVVVHQNPQNYTTAKTIVGKDCGPYPYLWEFSNVAMLRKNIIGTVRKIVNHAVTNAGLDHYRNRMFIKKNDDDHIHSKNTIEINFTYPIASDVSIHYRCSDNMKHSSLGILPFPTIISAIPPAAKYIYIHTEGTYENHTCYGVVNALSKDIEKAFPSSYVVVFKRHSIFESMYDFVNSRMALLCSASTFCLHAALGKIKGDIYMPRKYYGGKSNYGYSSWHYFEQAPRHKWQDDVENSTYANLMIEALRNITLFNNLTLLNSLTPLKNRTAL